jgi:hypothetical protein
VPPRASLPSRLLIGVGAALLALLVAEGISSLLTGRPLLARLAARPGGIGSRTAGLDAALRARDAAGGETVRSVRDSPLSVYRFDSDPRVGYAPRDTTLAPLPDQPFRTDALGMRVRPGGEPPEGCQRLVVLGDSVAFGMGLRDDETLAAQLEAVLADARGPAAPPLACFTVAGPGWNHRNAVSFLLDHFATYDPDIVVFLPTSNDLADTYAVDEAGRSRVGYDPAAADPLLAVNWESLHFFEHDLGERVAAGETEGCEPGEIGPFAMIADIGPESRRRYDENAASIVVLAETLQRLGRHLVLLHVSEDGINSGYAWFLRERLLDRGLAVPEIPGLVTLSEEFTLGKDTHPNAATSRALALWVAADLLQRGWVVPGANRPLPDVGETFTRHRVPPRDRETIRAKAHEFREEGLAALQSTIDFRTGRGFAQVYGGLNPDGTLGARLLALLAPKGRRLRVTLEPLPDEPVLYPLDIAVSVNGAVVGTLTLPAGNAPVSSTFDLPASAEAGAPIDVRLAPARWTLVEYRRRSIPAAARLVAIGVED